MRPPNRRRPSWDSWIRPSLTDAHPSSVRQKPVVGRSPRDRRSSVRSPWQIRRAFAAHLGMSQIVGIRQMPAHQKSVARPCAVRNPPVASPWSVHRLVLHFHNPPPWAFPCEPPRTNATRTNTRRTPHRTRPNAERTTDEHRRARSTSAPLNSAEVRRPSIARSKSVASPW
jgi:hypothetical protein